MARPTRLTPQVQERILEAIRAGNYVDTAAQFGGISPATFYVWMARGREEAARLQSGEKADPKEATYLAFYESVEEARAQAEVRSVGIIMRAASESWQAAAWWLERTRPQRFARRERLEHSGPEGQAIPIQSVSPEDLDAKIQTLLAGESARESK